MSTGAIKSAEVGISNSKFKRDIQYVIPSVNVITGPSLREKKSRQPRNALV